MEPLLRDQIIFGPIKTRRLGFSLGINLLPTTTKYCNFNCIYCECGWTHGDNTAKGLPEPHIVNEYLIERIQELQENGERIDTITFAGNGEPTLHPKFDQVMADVILVRDLMIPHTKISVLTNATTAHKERMRKALMMADQSILKLDAGTERLFQLINQPMGGITLEKIKENLRKVRSCTSVQTMFLRGQYQGSYVDNTSKEEVDAWIEHIIDIQPLEVMLYSLDRPTPTDRLEAIRRDELFSIANRLKAHQIETIVI